MVEIKPDAVTPVSEGISGGERKQSDAQADAQADGEGTGHRERPPIDDAISILGIPPEEMTTQVRAAIGTLTAEIVRLREEVDHSRGRAAYLESLADRHPFLPVLNRRAFARELSKTLAHAGTLGTSASLLCLHVTSAEDIRRRHGRRALDAGLGHVCGILTENLHPTDVIGNLGGADFGIVLLVADKDAALAKGKSLVDAIGSQSFRWQDQDMTISLSWGARVLEPGADSEEVMAATDRHLLDMEEGKGGGVGGQAK